MIASVRKHKIDGLPVKVDHISIGGIAEGPGLGFVRKIDLRFGQWSA